MKLFDATLPILFILAVGGSMAYNKGQVDAGNPPIAKSFGEKLETYVCTRVMKCDPNSPNRVAPAGAW